MDHANRAISDRLADNKATQHEEKVNARIPNRRANADGARQNGVQSIMEEHHGDREQSPYAIKIAKMDALLYFAFCSHYPDHPIALGKCDVSIRTSINLLVV